MKVDTPHSDYTKFSTKWKKCRDVADGEVKEAKESYLPPLSGHNGAMDEEYKAYLARAHYYNATGRTVDALSGMVFSSAPVIEWPESNQFIDDVTLSGCSLQECSNEIVEDVLKTGRLGCLVDHTGKGENLTKAEAEQRNIRPKFALYPTESIINWRFGRVNGKYQLVLVVLKENIEEPRADDLFVTEVKTQYRVLLLDKGVYLQQIWEKGKGSDYVMTSNVAPTLKGKPFDYIPFRIFTPSGAERMEQPPLMDLVETNLAHYRTSADYEHGVHFAGLPTLFGSGFELKEGENFPIGSAQAFVVTNPQADAKFLEFEGAGLGEVRQNLDRKEQHMATLGARLLQESPRQVETAEAVSTKQNGENSVLASVATSVSKGLSWCMQIAAEWEGISEDVSVELNTDYLPETVDAQTISALLQAVQGGKLSKESFVYNLKRGKYLPEDRSITDELDDLENEDLPPVAPVLPFKEAGSGGE